MPRNPTATTIPPCSTRDDWKERLGPASIAAVEHLFLSAQPGERIISTWRDLRIHNHTSLQHSIAKAEEHAMKFIVVVQARMLHSWLDAFRLHWGLSTREKLFLIRGRPIVLIPQILLHKEATHMDIFRAFVIVNKVLVEAHTRSSSPFSVSEAAAALQRIHADGLSEKQVLTELAMTEEDLHSMVKEAQIFEQEQRHILVKLLTQSGWDMSRFSFGTQKLRVKW